MGVEGWGLGFVDLRSRFLRFAFEGLGLEGLGFGVGRGLGRGLGV